MDIFLFAASSRKDSVNKKLIQIVSDSLKDKHTIDLVDFEAFDMPLYNGDLEESITLPAGAIAFIDHLKRNDCLIISSPEYNFSVPGTLKNLIDWISRPRPVPWKKVPILLLSASPALAGGSRGLLHTRVGLEVCGAYVYPKMFSLSNAYDAFDEKNALKDESVLKQIRRLLDEFLIFVAQVREK